MPKIWKMKAWFHSKVSKVLGLLMLAGVIYAIYYVVTHVDDVWAYISGLFGFRQ